ncbi:unnamed protein product [Vitrella brassicaformis CCMP3155]|uniref:H(+)-exporting diphosphatase n=1 Tax=Vitrella brassicaformis (strain CCMP3155) TaxID=1169540 RepID=A0A0G4ES41_VITBC|nr:unnamed protein product [Vitrella brassicaformis CCMP3155]|eukprot:CEM01171.1 unnamed protein product [Vitrella brassicaformis CCMP3155]
MRPSRNVLQASKDVQKSKAYDDMTGIDRPRNAAIDMGDGFPYTRGTIPSPEVLGIGQNISSSVFGALSIVAFAIFVYSLQWGPGAPPALVGGWFGPLAWGFHVASWIQKKNGN